MLTDVALFEPNQRGRRVIDRFLDRGARSLSAPDFALARRMAETALFSMFRFGGRHETAGVWLDDMLHRPRRLWLMDRSLETRDLPEGLVLAMRVFEAEAFHAGFGIVIPVDAETYQLCFECAERGQPLPFRRSLAATLYGDELADAEVPPNEAAMETMEMLGGVLGHLLPDEPAPRPAPKRRRKPG